MDTIENICELLEKRVLSIKGLSGIGVVDYEGNGDKKIEIAVQSDEARDAILKITKEDFFKKYPISIITPGKTTFF